MKITTKRQAEKILVDSLFNPVSGRTLTRARFCNGKYKPGKYVGQEVPDLPGVHAVYAVTQRDKDGPYVRLISITE